MKEEDKTINIQIKRLKIFIYYVIFQSLIVTCIEKWYNENTYKAILIKVKGEFILTFTIISKVVIYLKKTTPFLQLSAFIICAVLFFFTTADSVLTVHDDILTYMQVKQGDLWNTIINDTSHGRISHIILLPMLFFPYFFGSTVAVRLISLFSVLFDVSALYLLIRKNVDKNAAYLSSLLFISFACISNQHNLFVSYIFAHQISIGIVIFALTIFTDYYREKKSSSLVISALLLTFAAFLYEAMAAYIILFILISMYKNEGNIFKNCCRILYDTHFHLLFLLIYVIIYAIWRYLHPSDYDGAKLYFENIPGSLITMSIYSLGMIPGLPLGAMFIKKYITLDEFKDGASIWIIIIPVISAVTFYYIYPKLQRINDLRPLTLLCIVGIIAPNIIISFTEKYVSWSQQNSYSYVTSFYSYFFMVPLFLIIIKSIFRKKLKRHALILLSIMIFIISLSASVGNTAWNIYFKKNLMRYTAFENAVSDDYFDNIPDGTVIYIPDYQGIHHDMNITADFARIYTDAQIYFENDENKLDFSENVICMRYDKSTHAILLGHIDPTFSSNDVYIIGDYNKTLPEYVNMKNLF